MMTFQPTSFEHGKRDLFQMSPNGLKHRGDYAIVVDRIGGDIFGAVECASTAMKVLEANDDSWHREWFAVGEAGLKRAKRAAGAGRQYEARGEWRRASIYFGAAELYLPYDDPRHGRTVERLKTACRGYIESLTLSGAVVDVPTSEGCSQGYLVRNDDPASPVVICVGGWDELKERLIPLIQPALAWGLSVLLVEPPRAGDTTGRGHDRFGAASFLMACVDYLEESGGPEGYSVAIYGVGAGASFAREVAQFDDRLRVIAGDFSSIGGFQNSALVRSFIGLERPMAGMRFADARQAATVIDTSAEMTTADIFNRIAARLLTDDRD